MIIGDFQISLSFFFNSLFFIISVLIISLKASNFALLLSCNSCIKESSFEKVKLSTCVHTSLILSIFGLLVTEWEAKDLLISCLNSLLVTKSSFHSSKYLTNLSVFSTTLLANNHFNKSELFNHTSHSIHSGQISIFKGTVFISLLKSKGSLLKSKILVKSFEYEFIGRAICLAISTI